ncbi:B3 domain-containing protein Os02g0598200 isoform X1 [Setaria italica]|uniref:B3 domain-containing protein Os02g0598200 isoform X1 n=1 Tax=Setaria italica TaxID=4555 RepID=UPI000645765C|nr:B3 domain-containing protein Os02g0598200 isoform X1 [Setaria italica]
MGKQKEGRASSNKNMMADDREKKNKTTTWNGHNKVKSSKKVSTTSLEKMRKKEKLCNANNKKKMQICDDEEGKNRKESTTISERKDKEKMNKTHKEKMRAANSKERKILSGHDGVKKSVEVSTAFFGKEKKGKRLNKTINLELQSDEDEEEGVWNYDGKVKNGKVATAFSEEEKRKRRPNNNTEKETAALTPAVKEKRMRPSESTEMMMLHDKPNGRNVASNVSKEKKMDTSSGSNYKKRKREEPDSLSKKEKRVWCNASDKKIYSGTVQEKKICGSGKEKNRQAPFTFFKFIYNYFEEFLLIPPAVAPKLEDLTNRDVYLEDSEKRRSKVRLSVVDGSLAFHQGWDIFVSDHLIKLGEFLLFEYTARKRFSVRIFGIDSCERLDFKKDPKRVEQGIGYGPPQDNNNGSLIDRQCKTKGTSPLHSKKKTVILISDSGISADNEDTLNITSDADSTHHVTINTNKDLKRVQSGVGNLPDGVCRTKCISPPCSEGKTSSEIIVTGAAPLMHENDGRVGHELEKHDLDEDLMRKQGINSIPSDSITAVGKHQNHSKTIVSQNIYRKYAAPGGFRCLEKWTKAIVNSPATLDGTVPIEPENTRKTGSILVDGYGSIGLNAGNEYFCSEDHHTLVLPVFTMPVKEPLSADRVSKFRHVGTDTDHSINEKGGGAAVQIQTQGEQLEPVGSIVISQSNNIPLSANTAVLGEYGALGRNPAGPEGTCAFVESMLTVPVEKPLSPDGISKCGSSRTEIDHNVNGKGTIVQLETNMDQVELVGSSVCSQSSNVAMHANHVVVHEPEHYFSRQEGRKSANCAMTESLLPMKDKILELDGHSLLKFSLQLCVPDTTRKWLVSCELPKSLFDTVKQKRHDRNVIMLKDPTNRLWTVLYHENPVFVGLTAGWKHFVAGNNLQTGDLCKLTKEADGDELVFSVQITKRRL